MRDLPSTNDDWRVNSLVEVGEDGLAHLHAGCKASHLSTTMGWGLMPARGPLACGGSRVGKWWCLVILWGELCTEGSSHACVCLYVCVCVHFFVYVQE